MSRIVTDPFSGRRGAGSFCVETESDINWGGESLGRRSVEAQLHKQVYRQG
ncbi:hypothetical protein [Stieleria neptunia]|uniref:hypothetical protein n=1 Tax=Stieleria neptunia TaxID=2527979 RepID=UPI001E489766|nr:hypothetical protein [Stieleria neptunia]